MNKRERRCAHTSRTHTHTTQDLGEESPLQDGLRGGSVDASGQPVVLGPFNSVGRPFLPAGLHSSLVGPGVSSKYAGSFPGTAAIDCREQRALTSPNIDLSPLQQMD